MRRRIRTMSVKEPLRFRWKARAVSGGPRRAAVLLLGLVLRLCTVFSSGAQQCPPDKRFGLSLVFGTNRTGHPHLMARLDQPFGGGRTWSLDVQLATAECGPRTGQREVLTTTFNGFSLYKPPPPGYTNLPGLGHFRRSESSLNWTNAVDTCAREGAVLALPATQQELDAVQATLGAAAYTWLGASDEGNEGTFLTVTGEPLGEVSTLKWASSEPDGKTVANCLLYGRQGRVIHDEPCKFSYPFYCKVLF